MTFVAPGAIAQDVDEIFLVRLQGYDQFSPFIVSLTEGGDGDFQDGPISFGVFVPTAGPGSVTGGTLTAPGSLAVPLVEDDDEWIYAESFEFLSEMDASYGPGTYEVALATANDGLKNVSIDLVAADYPALTMFSNFEAAQAVNPAQEFVLTWNAIAGGSADEFVAVEIEDEDGNTAFYSEDFGVELNGLSTAVTIPEDTLQPGARYLVSLEVYSVNESDSDVDYPGVLYGSGDGMVLRMPLQTTGGIFDDQAPNLFNSTPFDGREDYPRNAAVVFQFDERMDTSVAAGNAITWGGINPSLMTYTWNPEGSILFCSYQTDLPASAEVTWALNPAGSAAKLQDLAGNQLFPNQGAFRTSAAAPSGGSGILEVFLGKIRVFGQTGASPVDLGYLTEVYVDLERAGAAVSADLVIPGRGTAVDVARFAEFSGFEELGAEAGFAEADDLNRILPGGDYSVVINSATGSSTEVSVTFGADQYPSAPTFQGLAALQNVDPTQDITLTWDPMVGGTVDDSIFVSIDSENRCLFETPDIGELGRLDGTATSVTIPAGTLPPGRTLEVELAFVRVVDEDPLVSFDNFAAFASFTLAEISTSGDPHVPVLVTAERSGAGVTLTVDGETGFTYEVRASETLDLDPELWAPIHYDFIPDDCNGYLGSFQFVDSASGDLPRRFYQVRQLPNQ